MALTPGRLPGPGLLYLTARAGGGDPDPTLSSAYVNIAGGGAPSFGGGRRFKEPCTCGMCASFSQSGHLSPRRVEGLKLWPSTFFVLNIDTNTQLSGDKPLTTQASMEQHIDKPRSNGRGLHSHT